MPKINEDIASHAIKNTDFRRVILTNKFSQVVLMSVEPGDDIGMETHEVDQILYFVDGEGAVSYTHLTLPTKRIV